MRSILTLVTAISLAGCSLFMPGPPSNPHPNEFPRCHEDGLLPTFDAAWAVLYALSGGLVAASEPNDEEAVRGGLLAAGIGVAVFGSSAWLGYNKSKRCEQAKDAYRARYEQMQRESVPPPPMQLGPPSSAPLGPPSGMPLGPPSSAPVPAPAPQPAP